MIVWVASYPRSGNTYVRLVLSFGFGVLSGSAYRDPRLRLDETYPYRFTLDPDELPRVRAESEATFVKTHDLGEDSDPSPALCVVRDGRDALVSYARFAVEWGEAGFEGLSPQQALRVLLDEEGSSPFGGWSENVRSWTERAGPTSLLRFEELIASDDPVAMVGRAVAELEVPLAPQGKRPPSFEQLRAVSPEMFRRGKVGAWRNEMPQELEERFWERHGAEMPALGYNRDHPQ